MKKNYLLATAVAALLSATSLFAQQDPFFTPVSYRGAFDVNTNPNSDWTKGWANFNPDTITYPGDNGVGANVVKASSWTSDGTKAEITTNTTWTADKVYYLDRFVIVRAGATLTIEPGTIIRSVKNGNNFAGTGSLIIARGAKIMAVGTANNPIIFTSAFPKGQRSTGDWTGLMLFGNAKQNAPKTSATFGFGGRGFSEQNFEVFPADFDKDIWFGGNDDADNSGVLQFCRIEYGGWYQVAGAEINGLTFGAIGNGTTIDHIQCSLTNDDSFEWFGGTVNHKYLIAFKGIDDEFDTDCGYRGKLQFLVGLRDPNAADMSSGGISRGFESDNNTVSSGVANVAGTVAPLPNTAPIFSNVTLVGPIQPGQASTTIPSSTSGHWGPCMTIRTNSSLSVFNTVAMAYVQGGIFLQQADSSHMKLSTYTKAIADSISAREVVLSNLDKGKYIGAMNNLPKNPNNLVTFDTKKWFMTAGYNNDTTVANLNDLNLVDPQNLFAPDFRPKANSALVSGADFNHPKLKLAATDLTLPTMVLGLSEATFANSELVVYPNPTTGAVNVAFDLVKSSTVTIEIYSLTGEKVATLNNSELAAGHQVVSSNTNLTTGVYFVKVSSNNSSATIKLAVK